MVRIRKQGHNMYILLYLRFGVLFESILLNQTFFSILGKKEITDM